MKKSTLLVSSALLLLFSNLSYADYDVDVYINKPAKTKVVVVNPAPAPKVVVVKPAPKIVIKPRRILRPRRVVVRW